MAKKRRKKDQDYIAATVSPSDSRALNKQERYGPDNLEPGQIPTRGTLRVVCGPIVDRPTSAYGERLGVERPTERGRGKPREGQL